MAPPRLVHDLPEDDVIAHEASERCVCGPSRRPLGGLTSDGQRGFVVVHPRLDGRPAPESSAP